MATGRNAAKQVEDEALTSASEVGEIGSVLEYSEDVSEQERPEPLPAGEYPFAITAASIHTSKSTGNRSLKLTCEISPDDMPADYVSKYQVEKKVLTKYVSCVADNPQSRFTLKTLCQNLRQPIPGRSFDPQTLIGSTGKVTVTHDAGLEGEMREQAGHILKA